MAVAFKTELGTQGSATGGAPLAIALTAAIAIGDLVVVRVAYDNLSATTPTFTCTDSGGNTYTQHVQLAVNATAAAGISGAILCSKATAAVNIGQSITITGSGSVTAKAAYAESFTGVLNTTRSTPVSASGASTAVASPASGAVSVGDLVIGAAAIENNAVVTGDSDTTAGSWSTLFVKVNATGGTPTGRVQAVGQYKIATGTNAQQYQCTITSTEWVAMIVVLQAEPQPSITQAAYQFFVEGTESGATSMAAVNTAITADITNQEGDGALRIRLQSTTAVAVPATDDFQLQWEKNASGTWTNVTTAGTTVDAYDAPSLTEGAATTNRLGAGLGSFVAGKVSEDGLVDNLGWTANNYTELLFSLVVRQTGLLDGDTLRFRVLRNGATTDMTYTVTPTINVIKTPEQTWVGNAAVATLVAATGTFTGITGAVSLRVDAADEGYTRSAAGISTTAMTMCCWVKWPSHRNDYYFFLGFDNASSSWNLGTTSANALYFSTSDGNIEPGTPHVLTTNTWYHVAITWSSTGTDTMYVAAEADADHTTYTDVVTQAPQTSWQLNIGTNGWDEWSNVEICAVKIWTATLSDAEIATERGYYTPIRLTNLWAAYPFDEGPDTADYSGNGRTLSLRSNAMTAGLTGPDIEFDLSGPQTWSGNDAVVHTVATSGAFVSSGPQTWTGNPAVVQLSALSGSFSRFTWPTTRSGRKILDQNGDPWMIKGQAVWSLGTVSQADQFTVIDALAAHGHNCIMVTITETFYSNNSDKTENFYGESPFVGNFFGSALNSAFWDRWIDTVEYAASKGISFMCVIAYAGFGGDGSKGFMNARTTTECQQYGNDIATLHLGHPNIMYMIGGDLNFTSSSSEGVRYNAMMLGIKAADSTALIFGHSASDVTAYTQFGTGYSVAIDANHVYTYDGGGQTDAATAWTQSGNTLPLYFIEGAYWHGEDSPDQLFRSQLWMGCSWGLGCFDGHVELWSMGSDSVPTAPNWPDNLTAPEMNFPKHCYDFYSSVAWGETLPDFGSTFVTTGVGTGNNRAAVCFGGNTGIVYFPNSRSITCDLSQLEGQSVHARWYDPTDATYTEIGHFGATAGRTFTHPGNTSNNSGESDWVLLLESSEFTWPTTVSGRQILDQLGNPWQVRGDSGWSIFAMLTLAEAEQYLDDRVARGYNTILCSLVEHFFATNAPNNIDNDPPFTGAAFQSTLGAAYFNRVDAIIQMGLERGITFIILPAYLGFTGTEEGWDTEVGAATNAQMTTYGTTIGTRYASYPNIIWSAGGDRNPSATLLDRHDNMMVAIGAVSSQLMTAHAAPQTDAHEIFNSYSWLNISNVYGTSTNQLTVEEAQGAYSFTSPIRPLFYAEGRYENEPNPGDPKLKYRKQAWGSILGGCTAGTVFGNNPIWHFSSGVGLFPATPSDWESNLNSVGNIAMAALWDFLENHPWQTLLPDTTDTFLTAGESTGVSRVAAAFSTTLGVVYVPASTTVTIDQTELTGITTLERRWLDPTNGATQTATPSGSNFTTPGNNALGDPDWVLFFRESTAVAQTWTGNAATVSITATSGAFVGTTAHKSFIGTQTISAIKAGTSTVSKLYVGTTQVWPAAVSPQTWTGNAAALSAAATTGSFTGSGGAFDPLTSIAWDAVFWASDPGQSVPSDGATVTSWRQPGSVTTDEWANHGTPTFIASWQNGKPAIDFGTNDRLHATFATSNTLWVSMFIVGETTGEGADLCDDPTTGDAGRLLIDRYGGSWRVYRGGSVLDTGGVSDALPHLFTFRTNNTTGDYLKVDGVNKISGTAFGSGSENARIGLGCSAESPGDHTQCKIAFCGIVTGRDFTTQEQTDMLAWYNSYYKAGIVRTSRGTAANFTSTAPTLTYTGALTAGSTLIVTAISWDDAANGMTTPTSNQGHTFTALSNEVVVNLVANNVAARTWIATNAGTTTPTITFGGANYWVCTIDEYTGLHATQPDVSIVYAEIPVTGVGPHSPSTGNITPVTAGSRLYSVLPLRTAGTPNPTITAPSGWNTIYLSNDWLGTIAGAVADKQQSTATTEAAVWTVLVSTGTASRFEPYVIALRPA